MRFKMLKTVAGAEDGIHVREYAEGSVHDLGPELEREFKSMGVVEPAPDEAAPASADPAPAESPADLEEMTKAELRAHALLTYDLKLDESLNKASLIAAIRDAAAAAAK